MARPVLKKTLVYQKFDLEDIFGVSFFGQTALKEAIGQRIIDKMVDRTKSGVDINGKPFRKYSKKYIESPKFKAFGKSPSKVNLTLTNAMLGTLDVFSTGANEITLGWEDSVENEKAYNHNAGDTVPQRQFFGLTNNEVKQIKNEFKDDVKKALEVKKTEGKKAFEKFILEKIGQTEKNG